MSKKKAPIDGYLLLLLFIAVMYVAYWVSFSQFRYNSFSSDYFDIGLETYATYAHINYSYLIPGLQYIVFSGHISLLRVLLLPLSFVLEGPIGLFIIQDSAIALAAIVAYFCGVYLLRSRLLGFALAIGLLLSPGIMGLTIFDFHSEAFIALFFLLSFYFYMRKQRLYLAISFILLLSVMEYTWVVALSFIIGMAYFEFFHNRNDLRGKSGIWTVKTLGMCLLLTLLFLAMYVYVAHALTIMYQAGQYSSTPSPLKLLTMKIFDINYTPASALLSMAFFGVLIFYLSLCFFGLIFDPVLGLIFISPWLGGILVLHYISFFGIFYQYYSYSVGGAITASLLGLLIFSRRVGSRSKFRNYEKRFAFLIILSSVTFSALLLPSLGHGLTDPLIGNASNYSQFDRTLQTIPRTANVLAQSEITPHLYFVENLEVPDSPSLAALGSLPTYSPWLKPNSTYTAFYWFKPTYIVFDKQLAGFSYMKRMDVYQQIEGNYILYNKTGSLEIYVLK